MQTGENSGKLEQAAGPRGARTTELVGVDDIGLPSGIQPEDAAGMSADAADTEASGDSGGDGSSGSSDNPTEKVQVDSPELAPGDEAAPGTVGTGDDTCPVCSGSGKNASGGQCPNCRGTGVVTEGIGGG
jgi:DnaJ-class molecular chaperone